MATDYNNKFFRSHQPGVTRSAEVVVPLVLRLVEPDSVVDVGCGTGVWLSTFTKNGVTDILGIDGDYVDERSLTIPANEFKALDLKQPFKLDRSFDLAVCLEVAEHLPPESAENFVGCLCELAPVTLFSAAIPFQGGVNHINEQWPEYWEQYFNDHGFVALDPIRPEIWRNDDVEFWYAQNVLLYVRKDQFPKNLALRKLRKARGNYPLSVVHPTRFIETAEKLSDALRTYEHYAEEARIQESSAADLRAELTRTTSELEQARADAETAQARLESETWRLEDELKAAREWAEQRGQKIALLRDETNAIQRSAQDLRAELNRTTSELEQARADAETAQARLESETWRLEDELKAAREWAEQRGQKIALLRDETNAIQRSAQDLRAELNRTTSELEQARADAETAQARLESETWRLEDELNSAREWAEQRGEKIALLRDETNAIQRSAQDLRAELNRTTSELEQARADAETAQARLESETWRLEDELKAAREWAEQRGQKIALLRDEKSAIQNSAERLTTEIAHYKFSADPHNMSLGKLIMSLGRSIRSLPRALVGAVMRRKTRFSNADGMYAIVEIELTREFVTLKTADDVHGFGFVVRQNHRPVGFFMVPIPPNTRFEPMDVRELILENIRPELMEDSELPTAGNEDSIPREPSLTVTAAICTKDHPEDLKNCLTYLQACRASSSGRPFDVLVVDNAPSSPASRDIVATMPDVRYVVEPKPGLNFARNRAIQEARSDIIAFIDDDVTVDRNWYRGLKRALENHPDAGAVTGLVLPAELQTRAQVLFEANGGFEKSYQTIRYEKTLPGHPFYPCIGGKFGTGCNMAFRREILLELNGFDEALDTGAALPGGGDTDMLYRVVRAGYPLIYEPEYMLFHRHRREYHQLRDQLRKSWGEGLMAFVVKTYKQDPTQRGNLRRLVGWWFAYHLRQLYISITGRHALPPDILAAQLWGGIVGLLISYPRSVRRTKRIRQQYS